MYPGTPSGRQCVWWNFHGVWVSDARTGLYRVVVDSLRLPGFSSSRLCITVQIHRRPTEGTLTCTLLSQHTPYTSFCCSSLYYKINGFHYTLGQLYLSLSISFTCTPALTFPTYRQLIFPSNLSWKLSHRPC